MITEMEGLASLGKSDHVGIKWKFVVEAKVATANESKIGY